MRKWATGVGVILAGAMLALTACSVFGLDDKAIVSDIQSKLYQDSQLKQRDIHVTANHGMVILTGSVNTELERAAAERLARDASGVKQVQDQLSVTSGLSAAVTQQPPAAATGLAPETAPEPVAAAAMERPKPLAHAASHKERAHADRLARAASYQEDRPPVLTRNEAATPAAPAAPTPVAAAPAAPTPPPPPQPVRLTIPEGTVITIRTIDSIDSTRDRAGQDFDASIFSPVVIGERVVIPQGAEAKVRLVSSSNAGRISGTPEVALELSAITVARTSYTTSSTLYQQKGPSRTRRTEETVGGGAVLGGLIGAIAGRGKGAAIGSVIGAGAGTAAEAGTKAAPVRIAAETKIEFTLRSPVAVTLPPSGENGQ